MSYPLPENESERLESLRLFNILDTPAEKDFDDLTEIAALICGAPISAISLLDAGRQWFKSKVGFAASETPREIAFCSHTILQDEVFVVPNTTEDERFADNPLVTSDPNIRFYAGAPIVTEEGNALGTICVIDIVPRTLSPEQENALQSLSRQAMRLLKLRQQSTRLETANLELKAKEENYRFLAESVSQQVWTAQPDGNLDYVNQRVVEYYGFNSPGEGLEMTWLDVLHPNDKWQMFKRWNRAIQAGSRFETEYRLRRFDGEYRWHLGQAVPMYNETGEIIKWFGTNTDIHDRKLAEEALSKSEQYQNLFKHANDAILIIEPESETVLNANAKACEMYGFETGEFIGMSLKTISENAGRGEEHLQKLLEIGTNQEFETVQFRADGTPLDLLINAAVIEYEGQPAVLSINRDITARRQMENALREREQHLLSVTNSAQDAIVSADNHGNIIFWNEGAQKIFGYGEKEIIGKPLSVLMPEKYREAHVRGMRRYLESGEASLIGNVAELHGLKKDGSEFPLEIALGAWETIRGKYFTGILRDITERKEAEYAVQESKERFRLLVEGVEDYAILMLDTEGNIISWNAGAERVKQYKAKEIIGKHFRIFYTPEDQNRKYPEEELRIAAAEGRFEDMGWRVRKDGSRFFANVIITAIKDDAGRLQGFSKITRDITERKEAEDAIKEMEQRYRLLAEGIPHQVWTALPDGKLDYVNHRTLEYFGLPLKKVTSDGWKDLVHPDDLPECLKRWKISLQSGDDYEVVFRLRRANGEYCWHIGRAVAGYNSAGEIIKWFGTNTDVDNQHKAEEALRQSEDQLRQAQKMEAIGHLAGGIAHDFNNLLTAINGYGELTLRRLAANDPLRGNIEEIKKAGERAANLTRQLLAFSRKQILQPKLLDLSEVVANTNNLLRRLIGEDIDLILALSSGSGKIMADPGQIEQVLLNLAVNARDAMPTGGRLTIAVANVEMDAEIAARYVSVQAGAHVLLTVSDTGTGMDATTRKHAFEPFFTTKEPGKGTGLGLSTVYGIVKQSGGYVTIESEIGLGTTFKIYLPRVDETIEAQDEAIVDNAPLQGSETILLVEDDEMIRNIAREILEAQGYTLLITVGGNEALHICETYEGVIHLLLTDVVMPQMSGREVAENVAALRPGIKVIYMSGYTDDAIVHHGVLDDGIDFIEKPFTPDALASIVREVLDRRQA